MAANIRACGKIKVIKIGNLNINTGVSNNSQKFNVTEYTGYKNFVPENFCIKNLENWQRYGNTNYSISYDSRTGILTISTSSNTGEGNCKAEVWLNYV